MKFYAYTCAWVLAFACFTDHARAVLPGGGTETNPWRIRSLTDFNEFAGDDSYWDDYTRLETNLSLSGTYDTAVIAPDTNHTTSGFQGTPFTGVFDGNDLCIEYLEIDTLGLERDYLGFFGKVGSSGVIKNFAVGDIPSYPPYIHAIIFCEDSEYVGGLAGENNGLIENCYAIVYIGRFGSDGGQNLYRAGGLVGYNSTGEIRNSFSMGNISTDSGCTYIGGLVGHNNSSPLSRCFSEVKINIYGGSTQYVGGLAGANQWSIITQCYALGNVTGSAGSYPDYAGGLVGWNALSSNINNCYAVGDVTGRNFIGGLVGDHTSSGINKCYSIGAVSGSSSVGGLVGDSDDGDPDVYDSYWDVTTSGTMTSDGGTWENTMMLKRQSRFTNWDFADYWQINDHQTYPLLRFYNRADLNKDHIVNLLDFAAVADNWLQESN